MFPSVTASARQLTKIHYLKDHGLMSFPIKRIGHYIYVVLYRRLYGNVNLIETTTKLKLKKKK
jgi:hypothetical protein